MHLWWFGIYVVTNRRIDRHRNFGGGRRYCTARSQMGFSRMTNFSPFLVLSATLSSLSVQRGSRAREPRQPSPPYFRDNYWQIRPNPDWVTRNTTSVSASFSVNRSRSRDAGTGSLFPRRSRFKPTAHRVLFWEGSDGISGITFFVCLIVSTLLFGSGLASQGHVIDWLMDWWHVKNRDGSLVSRVAFPAALLEWVLRGLRSYVWFV